MRLVRDDSAPGSRICTPDSKGSRCTTIKTTEPALKFPQP